MRSAYTPNTIDKRILRIVGRYHYITAAQAMRLLDYSPNSRTYVSESLNRMTKAGILDRGFVAQLDENGKAQRRNVGVWSVAALGREYLRDLGITPPFNKHGAVRTPVYYDHIIPVNDALIACELFARDNEDVELTQMIHEREIKRAPERVDVILGGKQLSTPVSADGWTDFRIGGYQNAIWWEVDRDTEHIRDWMNKVAGIVKYYDSGMYEERFGTDVLIVAVVVVPRTGRSPIDRMHSLIQWTEQALEHVGKKAWGEFFRFTPFDPVVVDPTTFFVGAGWLEPFDHTTAPLIEEAA